MVRRVSDKGRFSKEQTTTQKRKEAYKRYQQKKSGGRNINATIQNTDWNSTFAFPKKKKKKNYIVCNENFPNIKIKNKKI